MLQAIYSVYDADAFVGFKFASEAVAEQFFMAVGNELHRRIGTEYLPLSSEEQDEFKLSMPVEFELYYKRAVNPIVITNRDPVTEETSDTLVQSIQLLSAGCPNYRFTDVRPEDLDKDEILGYDKETSLVLKHGLDNVQATTADSVPESFKTLKELAAYVESAMFSLQA